MMSPYIAELCRYYVMIIFTLGVCGKLFSLYAFRRSIAEMLGMKQTAGDGPLMLCIALGVIGAEALAATLLFLGGTLSVYGGVIAALLTLCFAMMIAAVIFQKRAVRCNCFGISNEPLTALDLVRNMIVLCVCATFIALFSYQQDHTLEPQPLMRSGVLFCIALVFSLYTISMNQLRFLTRRASLD